MNMNQSKIRRGIDKARTSVRVWFSAWVDNPLEHRYHYRDGQPNTYISDAVADRMSQNDIIWHKVLGYLGYSLYALILVGVTVLITLGAVGK